MSIGWAMQVQRLGHFEQAGSWQPRHNLLSRGVADRRAWFDCLDYFDDEHAPVVAGGAFGQRSAGDFFVAVAIIGGGIASRRLGLWHGEKLTATGELLLSAAIAKEAVITDALEALGRTCSRKRRMNSLVVSAIVFCRFPSR